ncbi:MAG: Na+/H+ antiporter NhaC [Brevinema sp.]
MKYKQIPSYIAIIPLICMIILAVLSGTIYPIQLEWIMIFCASIGVAIALIYGHPFSEIEETISLKISTIWTGVLILMLIGAIVGTWMYSGTVPMLIYYGIKLLHPSFVPIVAFFVATAISMFTGTSWGAVATAGVAFMGVATALGVPAPIVAGAIISGAFFGDKNSPISDTTVLSALAAKSDIYSHIKAMWYTSIPAVIVAIILYIVLGLRFSGESIVAQNDAHIIMADLEKIFNFNILLLLPPVVVFLGAIKRWSALIVMTLGAFSAMLLGLIFQPYNFIDATTAFVNGYHISMNPNIDPEAIHQILHGLLNRGGLASMMQAVRFASFAMAFGAVLQVLGVFEIILKSLSHLVKSVFSLIFVTWFSSMLINSVVGSGQFTFFISADIMRDFFKKYKLAPSMLSRTLEEGVTLTEAFFPWHPTSIYMSTILGVPALVYFPYSFFNIVSIITMFIIAFIYPKINFGMLSNRDELSNLISHIYNAVGGMDNIISIDHCSTRIRLNIKDVVLDVTALDAIKKLGYYCLEPQKGILHIVTGIDTNSIVTELT